MVFVARLGKSWMRCTSFGVWLFVAIAAAVCSGQPSSGYRGDNHSGHDDSPEVIGRAMKAGLLEAAVERAQDARRDAGRDE